MLSPQNPSEVASSDSSGTFIYSSHQYKCLLCANVNSCPQGAYSPQSREGDVYANICKNICVSKYIHIRIWHMIIREPCKAPPLAFLYCGVYSLFLYFYTPLSFPSPLCRQPSWSLPFHLKCVLVKYILLACVNMFLISQMLHIICFRLFSHFPDPSTLLAYI